ncbi:MAG: PKD domain-containing protein [Bacteroidetes bacterium]|nr:PKD domain-containing protein [Bacteroidota bacterium]
MKTLKTLVTLLAVMLAGQTSQAQCAYATISQQGNSDTILVGSFFLASDSLLATITWDFGDGTTYVGAGGVQHVYGATGNYSLCYTYSGPQCTSTQCDSVHVDVCTGNSNIYIGQSVSGGAVNFSITGAPYGSTYNWHFGAGASPATSTSDSPSVVYPANNTYNDYVTVSTPNGCIQNIGFVVNTTTNCATNWTKQQYGNDVNFSPQQYMAGASYEWSFGDGQVSNLFSPSHTYSTYGNYNVCLTVSTTGCTDSVCQIVTTSAPVCPHTDSLFTFATHANGLVDFYRIPADSSQLFVGTVISIDYGNGTIDNFPFNHSYTYNASGSYNVCATFSNSYCTVTQCETVDVDICNISTSIGTTLYGTAINYYLNNANPSWTYQWSFPGGSPSTSTNATELVSYAAAGDYSATVTVSAAGCAGSSSYSTTVHASNDSCNANFTYTLYGSVLYVHPQDSTFLMGGNAYFNFGDGTTSTQSGHHNYAATGTYTVTYVVNTPYCNDSTTQVVSVTSTSCNAQFTYATSALTANFTPDDPSPNGYYNYGDGQIGTYAYHNYTTAGTYTVCYIVTGSFCTDSVCKQITISGPSHVTIEGTINKSGGGVACDGIVYLVTDTAGYLTQYATYSIIDSGNGCSGYYHFIVPTGNYYIKAALTSTDIDYANYMPTYYGDELNWANATQVIASGSIGYKDINLIAGTNPGGPGFIGGLVSQGAGLGVINNHNNRAVGDPLPNIQINLLTDNDVPVAYTYSDGSGMFAFNNIPLGSYKVYAEAISKTPITETVTLTANNPSASNVNVEVNTSNAVTSVNDIAELKVDAVYPNPVKDVAMVRFTAKQNAEAKVQVTDVRGVIVYTSATDINIGSNELKIDLANHAAGVYVVTLTNRDNYKTIRLLKAN